MPLMTWNDALSVGVEKIDSQHMQLVSLLNALHDAMKTGRGKDVIADVMGKLIDYTRFHFATEEELFIRTNYPKAAEHVREHEALRAQARDLQKKMEANQLTVSIELTSFLRDWVSSHIRQNDIEFGRYLQSIGMK